jgi:hypothetical protein
MSMRSTLIDYLVESAPGHRLFRKARVNRQVEVFVQSRDGDLARTWWS